MHSWFPLFFPGVSRGYQLFIHLLLPLLCSMHFLLIPSRNFSSVRVIDYYFFILCLRPWIIFFCRIVTCYYPLVFCSRIRTTSVRPFDLDSSLLSSFASYIAGRSASSGKLFILLFWLLLLFLKLLLLYGGHEYIKPYKKSRKNETNSNRKFEFLKTIFPGEKSRE